MADSEILRALQARLAQQPSAAVPLEGRESQWLAVRASGQHYLIALAEAGEIFPWQEPTALPYTQGWFLGVVNLRGTLVGVVDVGQFMGHGQPRSALHWQQARLITTRAGGDVHTAILVDALQGLRGDKDGFVPAPALPREAAAHFGLGAQYLDADGVVWQVLLLSDLVDAPEFVNVRL